MHSSLSTYFSLDIESMIFNFLLQFFNFCVILLISSLWYYILSNKEDKLCHNPELKFYMKPHLEIHETKMDEICVFSISDMNILTTQNRKDTGLYGADQMAICRVLMVRLVSRLPQYFKTHIHSYEGRLGKPYWRPCWI